MHQSAQSGSKRKPTRTRVSLADKSWKSKRVPGLEDLLVARLARASGRDAWQEFADLDALLEAIGAGADDRLAFQASFPDGPV